jgi:hypothetical protein
VSGDKLSGDAPSHPVSLQDPPQRLAYPRT